MILVGNQRGGGKGLALHLLKDENEHVEIYQVRGFATENLVGALNEAYAVSRGTQCKQFLFSLSLNPPPVERVKTASFIDAIERVEKKLGLSDQPRAIVFHEKEGRRHAHVVWSRIDIEEMKAVQLSFTHKKLRTISHELYLEHGWKMPRGLINSEERDPKNFTLAEWQQAKRVGKDPRAIKAAFQDAWAISDSKSAFAHALEERGYKIARGDRRGFVAVDYHGEVYSIPKWTGIKTKQVRERLGDERVLPSVSEVKDQIAQDMLPAMERFRDELHSQVQKQEREFERRRQALVNCQKTDRQALRDNLEKRWIEETQIRQARFRPGLKGLWDRLRGEHKRIQKQNEREARIAFIRDREEIDTLVFRQLEGRRRTNQFHLEIVRRYSRHKRDIQQDMQGYQKMREERPSDRRKRRSRRMER